MPPDGDDEMDAVTVIPTDKSGTDACAALERAIAGHGFGILHVHNMQETLAKKGVTVDRDIWVYDICNPQRAKEVLDHNPIAAAALPCAVAVIEEGTGAEFAFLRPTAVLGLFGVSELADVARDVETSVTAIVRDAALQAAT